jgi:spermidine/putrescine transport system substrate-binding protein
MHPREGWTADGRPPGRRVSRRGFLARTAGAGLAATSLGSLLDACGPAAAAPRQRWQLLLPRPNRPVAWPVFSTNEPIGNGLRAERQATLRIFSWVRYVSQQCLDEFARKYRCQVELITFSTMTEAVARLASGRVRADVFMGVTIDVLGRCVEQQLIAPLNHSYLPNIDQAWPQFTNPFYDLHWQYTVPYTVYTTGIAWRKDFVPENPYVSANGWEFLRQPKYRGKVAILDDYRESLSLGLLMSGITDLNTNDPGQILTGQQALIDLARATRVRIDNLDYTEIPSGRTWIHHAWSGDIAAAGAYLPKGVPVDVIGYWFPTDGQGPVANDTNAVLHGARNPVLAHLFLNFMLGRASALTNIRYNGYMQPLTWITPKRLVYEGILPRSLVSTAVLPTYFGHGLKELQLPVATDQFWQHAWGAVTRLA